MNIRKLHINTIFLFLFLNGYIHSQSTQKRQSMGKGAIVNVKPNGNEMDSTDLKSFLKEAISSEKPTVRTLLPTYLTARTADIAGWVWSNSKKISFWFEIEGVGRLGDSNMMDNSHGTPRMQYYPLLNLKENTTYTYKICAKNEYGTTVGKSVSFTTFPNDSSIYERNVKAKSDSLLVCAPTVKGFAGNKYNFNFRHIKCHCKS